MLLPPLLLLVLVVVPGLPRVASHSRRRCRQARHGTAAWWGPSCVLLQWWGWEVVVRCWRPETIDYACWP